MKDYKEMANDVLDRIHEYDAVKIQKRKKITKATTIVCPVSVAVIAGLAVWKAELFIHSDSNMEDFTEQIQTNPTMPDRTIQTESEIKSDISDSGNYYKPFSANYNPDTDAYIEDKLALVEVIISGNHYSQLDISEYPDYNIPYKIYDSDFGEFIGNIVEINDNTTECAVSSKEPDISDAEVYYYAPANSNSVVIVKKNKQCSIFTFTGQKMHSGNNYSSFEESFSYYSNVLSADIRNISYTISISDNGLYKISSEGIIEDSDKINSIADILKQLIPEENTESTPQWYIDGMSAYKANPDAYTAENIMLEIHFNNGTVMKDIEYQPFIGNGYVSGMKELTISQNTVLRSLLD